MKISALIRELKAVKDDYDWTFDRGGIGAVIGRQGKTIRPIVAMMRKRLARPGLRRYRRDWATQFQDVYGGAVNFFAFVEGCNRHANRMSPRALWARKLIIKTLGLEANDE